MDTTQNTDAPEPIQPSSESPSPQQGEERDWKAAYELLLRQYQSAQGNNAQLSQKRRALEEQLKAATEVYEAQIAALRGERDELERQLNALKAEVEQAKGSVSKIERRFNFLTRHPELSTDVLEGIFVVDDADDEELEKRAVKYKSRLESAAEIRRQEKQIGAAPPPPPNTGLVTAYTPAQIRELYNQHLNNRTLDTPDGRMVRDLFFQMVAEGKIR